MENNSVKEDDLFDDLFDHWWRKDWPKNQVNCTETTSLNETIRVQTDDGYIFHLQIDLKLKDIPSS